MSASRQGQLWGRAMRWDQSVSERLKSPVIQLLLLLAFSLVYRMSTFGHPNMDSDEAFYLLIGQSMHAGMIPYVDIWDRKPFGLFALYYIFAGLSDSVLVYQIAAWLCVGTTAWFIGLIAAEFSGRRASIPAGIAYVLIVPVFLGWGGQAPVFYNTLMAAAAWLVVKSDRQGVDFLHSRHIDAAMFLCSIAITIKQTALFESVFIGIYCAIKLFKSHGLTKTSYIAATRWMIIGATPTIMISFSYYYIGHWQEYWQAMFVSNLAKQSATPVTLAARAINTYLRLFPLLCVVLIAMLLRADGPNAGRSRRFLIGWLVSAWIGFFIVPNLYPHYVLPLLVPMCTAAGRIFSRRDLGLILFALLALSSMRQYSFDKSDQTRRAQAAISSLAKSIRAHDQGRDLLIFDGPVLLYSLTGHRPMSPLALPLHINYEIEKNVSQFDTDAEVKRMLSNEPGVVLIAEKPRNNPINAETFAMVEAYIKQRCRLVDRQLSSEIFRTDPILVYGDCSR